jgi:glycerol-3-phosphate acyltransferase PlsY
LPWKRREDEHRPLPQKIISPGYRGFSLFSANDIIVIIVSYLLGCFATGYYLVRLRTGEDIRSHGSGAVGARNVGRELGAPGFVLTFLVDFTKGALAVWAATYFGLSPWGVMLSMHAVVIGHIWPAQLGFRGGKGIATGLGAILAFDSRLAVILILLFGFLWVLVRDLTLRGLVAISMAPFVAAIMAKSHRDVAGITLLVILILMAHRTNIRNMIIAIRTSKDETEVKPATPRGFQQ